MIYTITPFPLGRLRCDPSWTKWLSFPQIRRLGDVLFMCIGWNVQAIVSFFLNVCVFLRERDGDRVLVGRGWERGRHRIWSRLQALSCQHRARRGAWTHKPQDHDPSRSPTLNWLSHPGAPELLFSTCLICSLFLFSSLSFFGLIFFLWFHFISTIGLLTVSLKNFFFGACSLWFIAHTLSQSAFEQCFSFMSLHV